MSTKLFSDEVNFLMENSISPSLKLLLEEEKEEKGKEEEFGDESVFDDPDEPDDPEDSEDTDIPDDSTSSAEAEKTSEEYLEQVAKGITQMEEFLKGVTNDQSGLFQVSGFLSSQVAALSNEDSEEISGDDEVLSKVNDSFDRGYKLGRKNKISYFLNEETDVKKLEKDIEAIDNIIDKGTSLIDKFKKGTKINISHYVESSINAYRNFDNLFAKESIIKQAAMNLILLNSGAKAEENIREYEELFHEELHKQFGIEYEEHAVITKSHHTAVGAVSQG